MVLYLKKVRELLRKFVLVQFRHISRAENSREDALARLATVPVPAQRFQHAPAQFRLKKASSESVPWCQIEDALDKRQG